MAGHVFGLGGVEEIPTAATSAESNGIGRFAVDEHNKRENALLEFVRVVEAKEHEVGGTLHHLTLEAIDAGNKKVYEAKVWVNPCLGFKELQDFRHKGEATADLREDHLQLECIAKSMMGSIEGCAIEREEPWMAPALEDLLPQLSCEEQIRLRSQLRERERILKRYNYSLPLTMLRSEGERDASIMHEVRHALRHYNAKHPGDEFDAVKPLMNASVGFRGQRWYHVNFWARSRKSKKIKRFFAEVHYKVATSSSTCSVRPFPAEVHSKPATSSTACWVPPLPALIPIIEACIIIEEPLRQYRRSCAFCRGHLDILHPKGLKFVCGNDKYRMEQRLFLQTKLGAGSLDMPFTCPLIASQEEEKGR